MIGDIEPLCAAGRVDAMRDRRVAPMIALLTAAIALQAALMALEPADLFPSGDRSAGPAASVTFRFAAEKRETPSEPVIKRPEPLPVREPAPPEPEKLEVEKRVEKSVQPVTEKTVPDLTPPEPLSVTKQETAPTPPVPRMKPVGPPVEPSPSEPVETAAKKADPTPREVERTETTPAQPTQRDAMPSKESSAVASTISETREAEPVLVTNPRFRMRPEPPVYPAAARRRHEEGVVVLRALVSPSGGTERVAIWESSGFYRLDDAALEAVRGWRFEPARRAGIPVKSWVQVPVRFQLN